MSPTAVAAALLTALILIGSGLLARAAPEALPSPRAMVAHAIILIDGDAAFTQANGVTGGTGAAADPYVIGGWEIEQSGSVGIGIENTRAYFVIRNVFVHSPDASGWGIGLTNATHGRLEDSNVSGNYGGLYLTSSSNVSITGVNATTNAFAGYYVSTAVYDGVPVVSENVTLAASTARANGQGVRIEAAANVTLRDDDFSGNGIGVQVWSSRDVLVDDSNLSMETARGLETHLTERLTVNASRFADDYEGLHLYNSTNATIRGNVIGPSQAFGIYLDGSDFARVLSNSVDSNPYGGVMTYEAFDMVAANNTITRNGIYSLHFDIRKQVTIVDNVIEGNRGTYQGTYGGVGGAGGLSLVFARNQLINNTGGLYVTNTRSLSITDNVIEGADGDGMDLGSEGAVNVSRNIVSGTTTGIAVYSSTSLTLTQNTATANRESGVALSDFGGAVAIESNNLTRNGIHGFSLAHASSPVITSNNVSFNAQVGAFLLFCSNAHVYANTLVGNGILQGEDYEGVGNRWNASYPVGGNYWGNYTGPDQLQGPQQDQPGADGIGDVPYPVGSGDRDAYPLMVLPEDTSIPTVAIVSPAAGSVAPSQSTTVTGTAEDASWSGVKRVELRLNEGLWMAANGTSAWSIRIFLPIGVDLLEARAWDHGGNPSAVASVRVTYANHPPVASFAVAPAAGNITTVFAFNASQSQDAEDSAAFLEVRWDWTGDGQWDTGFSTTKVATHVFPMPGTYTVRLEVRDTEGATGNATMQVFVAPDKVAPSIVLVPPQDAVTGSEIDVTANISDPNGVANATLVYRGVGSAGFVAAQMVLGSDGRYHASIPAQSEAGDVAFYVAANDTFGNQALWPSTGVMTVHVAAAPVPVVLVAGALAAAVGVMIAVVALLLLRRRKRNGKSPPGNP